LSRFIPEGQRPKAALTGHGPLPARYARAALPIVGEPLEKAGAPLAAVLNAVLRHAGLES